MASVHDMRSSISQEATLPKRKMLFIQISTFANWVVAEGPLFPLLNQGGSAIVLSCLNLIDCLDQKCPERKMLGLLQAHERSFITSFSGCTAQPDQGSPGRSGDLQHGTFEPGRKYRNITRARWPKSVRPSRVPEYYAHLIARQSVIRL